MLRYYDPLSAWEIEVILKGVCVRGEARGVFCRARCEWWRLFVKSGRGNVAAPSFGYHHLIYIYLLCFPRDVYYQVMIYSYCGEDVERPPLPSSSRPGISTYNNELW